MESPTTTGAISACMGLSTGDNASSPLYTTHVDAYDAALRLKNGNPSAESVDVSSTTQGTSQTPSYTETQPQGLIDVQGRQKPCNTHDDSDMSTAEGRVVGCFSYEPKNSSRTSNDSNCKIDSLPDTFSALVSRCWTFGKDEKPCENNNRLVPKCLSKGNLENHNVSQTRSLRSMNLADFKGVDDEAVVALDMMREWGEKEKVELLLRHPRLEQFTAMKPQTPLSAVLTGFRTPATPKSETSLGGGVFPSTTKSLRDGTNTSAKIVNCSTKSFEKRTLARYYSYDDVNSRKVGNREPFLSYGIARCLSADQAMMGPSQEDASLVSISDSPLFSNTNINTTTTITMTTPTPTSISTTVIATATATTAVGVSDIKKVDTVQKQVVGVEEEEEEALSCGHYGPFDQFMENCKVRPRWRGGGRADRRALRVDDVLVECQFLSGADILQVLDDGTEIKGDEPSKSVIGRVIALADRSLRRRAGDESSENDDTGSSEHRNTDNTVSDDDDWVSAGAIRLQPQESVGDESLPKYTSAVDELCSVVELGRMAAACAELADYLKPSTATEVTT
ncbi:hypothetical protein LSM04_001352 [Trypanosoma melophagium]|uniref:uncharacterized protein n=1 Tax=Trypanosoma melophagium TaxID=715481 RepID=UPI00351A94B0|nr:hypothetical protein LSM04_001352 [Trypanosoma melophagium]